MDSAFLLFFEANVEMGLKLFRLFVNALQNFVSICINVKVHLFVIMGTQLVGITCQLIVNGVIVF